MAGGLTEIRRMLDDSATNLVLRMRHMNTLAALMGDTQLALETLPDGMQFYPSLFSNQQFWRAFGDEVRKTPEFKQRVEELGLVNYWRTTGNWADDCRPLEGSDDFECF